MKEHLELLTPVRLTHLIAFVRCTGRSENRCDGPWEGDPSGRAVRVEIRQLRYFLAVAEERHFSRAAERLHIAQPGLSQQIKALERTVGAALFDRAARPISLTDAGEKLLPLAKTIVETAARATRVAGEGHPNHTGSLRVAFPAIGHYPELARLLERFRDRWPNVELLMTPSFRPAMLDALARRSIDVAILFQPIDWRDRSETPRYARLGGRELVIALPAGHSLTALERVPRGGLLGETYVDWPDAFWPELAAHARQQLFGRTDHPDRVEVLEAVEGSVMDLVRDGRGFASVAIPPDGPLPTPAEGVVFRRVEDPTPLLEYGVAWVEPNASTATAGFVGLAEVAQ